MQDFGFQKHVFDFGAFCPQLSCALGKKPAAALEGIGFQKHVFDLGGLFSKPALRVGHGVINGVERV